MAEWSLPMSREPVREVSLWHTVGSSTKRKESWAKQAQTLAAAGFQRWLQTFAVTVRGMVRATPTPCMLRSTSTYSRQFVTYEKTASKAFSVVGGSMGGSAAGEASIASQPGENRSLGVASAPPPMARLTNLNHPPCTSLHATMLVGMDRVFLGFRSSSRNHPSRNQVIVLDRSAHAPIKVSV
jgi:hypothetical protein